MTLKLGLTIGGADGPALIKLVQEAERLGFDSTWCGESYGVHAVTRLAWLGATSCFLAAAGCRLTSVEPTETEPVMDRKAACERERYDPHALMPPVMQSLVQTLAVRWSSTRLRL